jgi:hypothetical protein
VIYKAITVDKPRARYSVVPNPVGMVAYPSIPYAIFRWLPSYDYKKQ